MPHDELDLKGLKCPLPVLFARRALIHTRPGETVTVLADDPLAAVDIPHMCHREGFEVVESEKLGDAVRFVLKRPA